MNAISRRPLTKAITVKCKAEDGRNYSMLLLTLSRSGCTLEPHGTVPAPSQDAQVQLPGLSYLPGRITRSSASEVRLEFDTPIYPPIFEHLKNALRG